jgi:hypothetical protein
MCHNPPRDGGSRWILQVAQTVQAAGHHCTVIGNNFLTSYGMGRNTQHFQLRWRSKSSAALRGLLTAGHYGEIKYFNQKYQAIVRDHVAQFQPDTVIIGFLWMQALRELVPAARHMIIDTHNDEWALIDGFIRRSTNPLARRLSTTSKRRLDTLMQQLPADTIMMHIAESDVAAHRTRRPDLQHFCVLPGITPTPRASAPDYTAGPKRLLFCGNLGNQINQDALTYFGECYWPTLADICRCTIAGSNPCKLVLALCQRYGWELVSNFDEEQKRQLYADAHFAVMPAPYGAGSKLKLLESIAHVLPTLTTTAGTTGGHQYPSFVTVCDDPAAWRHTITQTRFSPSWLPEMTAFAANYSDAHTMRPLLDIIEQ